MSRRILCFGELLLRLGSPARELLLQTPALQVHVGGAEANVGIALASLGHEVGMLGTVADNTLGRHAVGELRRHGVDTSRLRRAPGRMGLYFLETGALRRPSEVLYDRAGSAFALAGADAYDWPRLLAGADLLHLSGITPALGQASADAAIAAARTARTLGLHVVFDGNYRHSLWQAWDGDAPALLHALLACADTVFADHRDISIVLRRTFTAADPEQREREAAAAAFAAFPQLSAIASTRREQRSVDQQQLSARLLRRDGSSAYSGPVELAGVVDRIGAGDAFAAGLLHALLNGMNDADGLAFGLAAACLKHSVPGDFLAFPAARIAAFLAEARLDVRR